MAFPKARKGPRRGSLGSNQCLWCATSRNGSAFGRPMGITLPPAHDGHTGIRGHCWISPARLEEAVLDAPDAAAGLAAAPADTAAAAEAASRRVNVPGLRLRSMSGNFSQFFCERAAVFPATAKSKQRRSTMPAYGQLRLRGRRNNWRGSRVSISRRRRTRANDEWRAGLNAAVSFAKLFFPALA